MAYELPIFPFPSCCPSQGDWLIQGSNMDKKGYGRLPWSFVFLRMPSPSFFIPIKFWFEREPWPVGTIKVPAYSTIRCNPLTLHLLNPAEFPHITGPLDTCEHYLQMEAARNGRHISCLSILLLSMLRHSLRFLIQNTSSKTEWLRMSGWRQLSINQAWGPGEDGAPWDCRVHMPEVGAIWRFPSDCGFFQNLRHLSPLSPFGAKSPNLVNKKISTQFPVMFAWQSLLVFSSSSLIIEFPVFNGHKAT